MSLKLESRMQFALVVANDLAIVGSQQLNHFFFKLWHY